jgi:hypothetical protein
MFIACIISSINLHNKMFQAVIRSPLQFFDDNPVGIIRLYKSEMYFIFKLIELH